MTTTAPVPQRPSRGLTAPDKAKATTISPKPMSVPKTIATPTTPIPKATGGKVKKKGKGGGKHPEQLTGDALGRYVSQALAGALHEAAKEFGDDTICVAGEVGRLVIGIELPSFCWEVLLQNTVLRLGIMIQVLGVEGSCKSGLIFEFVRWFAMSQGVGELIENEDKFDPNWANAIFGKWDRQIMGYLEAGSSENVQELLLDQFKRFKLRMDGQSKPKIKGCGRIFPVLFLLDSLMGKPSEETMKNIHEDGHAGRRYALEAMQFTDFLKTLATEMKGWPFLFVFTNHLKLAKDNQGRKERRKAGGALKDFQETMELELTKTGKKRYVKYKELQLQIECRKNSMGETGNRMQVNVRTWTDKETKKPGAKWMWHESTINMLHSYPKQGEIGVQIAAVVDLHKLSGDLWWSKTLGVSKANPVEAEALGEKLHARKDLLDKLRPIFGVQVRKVFEPGVSYTKQRRELKQIIDKELEKQ